MQSGNVYTKDIQRLLIELDNIVESRKQSRRFLRSVPVFAVCVTCVIVIWTIGYLLGLLLISVILFSIAIGEEKGMISFKAPPSDKELSERACQLMSSCINLSKYPHSDPASVSRRMVLVYGNNGNLPLYEEFISLFPHMASRKLRKLASIKLGN